MPVDVNRIQADIRAIAACTHTPGNGATRPTFSPQWGKACDYVITKTKAVGCDVFIDPFGNLHARAPGIDANAKVWLCGSHIDTVPHGGDYDGVVGIVVALELIRSATDEGVALPLELIIFAEEEGPTFGLGMLGARAWVGELDESHLAQLKNADGENYFQAGRMFGVDATRFAAHRFDRTKYLGLIEAHIEQGPGMWDRDQRLAVVSAIAGRQQYKAVLTGQANHAGATSMRDRRDALACAAEIALMLESLAGEISPDAVCTIGRLSVLPGAVNVIPDLVEFTIDFRAPADDHLRRADTLIKSRIESIATRRGIGVILETSEGIPARPMNATLVSSLSENLPVVMSGALHDSAVMAPHLPTVMLFIPSQGGISHNPAEFSRFEDVAGCARHIELLVRRPTLSMLNAMPFESFVDLCGRFYEHSPWVARDVAGLRPFDSIDELTCAMSRVVRAAPVEPQMSLINAHPDLVGKLARQNRLTSESTNEQSAAGLMTLTPDEVAAFEAYNAAYRSKFGFPFIICARLNKKQAILAAFPVRLKSDRQAETQTALAEIDKIARLRAHDAIWEEIQ